MSSYLTANSSGHSQDCCIYTVYRCAVHACGGMQGSHFSVVRQGTDDQPVVWI